VNFTHWCAACQYLLPDDDKTGWENWVFIAPGGDDANVFKERLMSLVRWGHPIDMRKAWTGDWGCYLPLCKSCMTKFIKELPENNMYDDLKALKMLEEHRTELAQAKGKGRLSLFQAALKGQKLEDGDLEKRLGSVIAGLLQQQLRMMVKNARDTIREEAKAEEEAKVAAEVAESMQEHVQDTQLNDAGNTNEEKDNAGNTDSEI
jgi:hypothetical protein